MQALPGYTDVVYGRYARGSGDRVWLQYWLFYLFNDKSLAGIGLHEGDWEMVQVAIDDGRPSGATFAQHSGAEKRDDWADVRTAEGTGGASPLVYVGLGSHASYFDPGEYRISLFPMLDHARGNGRRVRPRVVEADGRRRLAGMARPLGAHGPQRHVEPSRAAAAREAVEAPGRVPRRRPRTAAQAGTDLRRRPRGRAVPPDHRAARWRRRPHQLRRACRGGAAGAAAALGRVHRPPRGALHALVRRGGETGDRPSPGAHRRGRLRRARDGTRVRRTPRATPSPSMSRLRDATGRPLPARASRCGCWSSSPTTGAAVSPRCARRSAQPSAPTPTAGAGRSDTCSRRPAGARDRRGCAAT